jgi:RNA 3'-terminal phosphate cyclase
VQYSSSCCSHGLQIKKRGAAPLGGGEVQFLCPVVKGVNTLNFVDPGKIKRIRGIACVVHSLLTAPLTI